MKKFIYNLLIYSPILIIIVVVNYFVDPAHRYARKNYVSVIVKMLDQGHVTNVDDNYDARRFQISLIEHRAKTSIDILVLGSSRTMLISEKLFPGKTCLNLSVSGAGMNDEAALYQACLRNQIEIKRVILLVDPDFFNETNSGFSGKALEHDYQEYLRAIDKMKDSKKQSTHQDNSVSILKEIEYIYSELGRKTNILSLSYFQKAIRYLLIKKKHSLCNTEHFDNPGNTIHTDGSWSYNEVFRNQPQKEIDRLGMHYHYKGWDHYHSLSSQKIEDLEQLVNYIRRNGSEVLIFNSSYHPYTYKRLITLREYRSMKTAMDFISEFASTHQLQVIGSFDPAKSNCDKTYFYDAHHMNASGIEKIISSFTEKTDSVMNRNIGRTEVGLEIHSTSNSRQ